MTIPWQAQLAAISHDWLKNTYLLALSKAVNLVDEKLEDSIFEEIFVVEVLPQWERRHQEIMDLIMSYDEQTSPRRPVRTLPIAALGEPVLTSLSSLVHELWLRRNSVTSRLSRATKALKEADVRYSHLFISLTQASSSLSNVQKMKACREELIAFRAECKGLASALTDLSNRNNLV